jgi:hypothetical protein
LREFSVEQNRLVPELRIKSYQKHLHQLDMPSLVYRHQRGDAIECFKYLHGYYNTNKALLVLHEHLGMETRGHSLKLQKERCYTRTQSTFLLSWVVNTWNSLLGDVVGALLLNMFKNCLDKHWCFLKFATDVCNWEVRK